VKGIDAEHEEGLISETVGLTLERLDLVVGSFQGSGRNPMIVVSEDALFVSPQGLGNILEYADAYDSARAIQSCRWCSAEALFGKDQRSLRSSFM